METTEIILRETGVLAERTITERDLDAGQKVLDALTSGVTRNIRNVFTLPDHGMVHASVGVYDTFWSVPITQIPLSTRFRLVGQLLVPVFDSSGDLEMSLAWQAPANVKLVFAVQTALEGGDVQILGNWLYACDEGKRAYRLPLPNLHDDCRICTGDFDPVCPTAHECIRASLEQFRKSKWNADLMRTIEQSQKFFRFKPTNDTFETLPVEARDWTTLCDKISTTLSERIIP